MKKQTYSEAIPARISTPISLTTLVQAAMIAAIYVVLTFIANAFGLANYAVQVRFSEALTILPYFTPAAIPGLFIGCRAARHYFQQSGNSARCTWYLCAPQMEMVRPGMPDRSQHDHRAACADLRLRPDDRRHVRAAVFWLLLPDGRRR